MELARRGGDRAVLMESADVVEQIRQLQSAGLVEPRLSMTRCSLCNTLLRRATPEEVEESRYAPRDRPDLDFFWCEHCQKLYWMGSHCDNLTRRLYDQGCGPAEDPDEP